MDHSNADRDSARVTAIIEALSAARLPSPTVESVQVHGEQAEVRLVGRDGVRATVHLRRERSHWRVAASAT